MKHNYFVKLAALLLPVSLFSQSLLTVSPNSSALQLVQAITGTGVSISNYSLNCGAAASGTFTYSSSGTNLAISGGVLLTTGAASDAANAGSYFCDVQNGNNFSDPNLISIDADAYNDVCLLQFDFVPGFNCISISYIFASEEYPTYVGEFNDGFGIFLTGPNPAGGTYTGQNIGDLPNGIAVSINDVNDGNPNSSFPPTNSNYFHNNYTTPNNDIAYDGYTTPITSMTQVYHDSTYHMKIAIADALDELYDSGVFISGHGVSSQSTPGTCLLLTTGIKEATTKSLGLSVYPNPATASLQISVSGNDGLADLKLIDILGNTVIQNSVSGTQKNYVMDISHLSNGVYFVTVSNEAGNTTKKIIVNK